MLITATEYANAVRAARTECEQEISAAAAEYADAMRPIAGRRKERGKDARAKRDQRITELKARLR